MNSKTLLMPPNVAFGPKMSYPPVATPGKTPLEREWNA